jgi:RNA polymerase primary sigma factor
MNIPNQMTPIFEKELNRSYNKIVDIAVEHELIARAQSGDIIARNKLIDGQLKMIIGVARKKFINKLSLEELVAEGTLGLIHGIDTFELVKTNHETGEAEEATTRLSSYAVWWVKAFMTKANIDDNPVKMKVEERVAVGKGERVVLDDDGEAVLDSKGKPLVERVSGYSYDRLDLTSNDDDNRTGHETLIVDEGNSDIEEMEAENHVQSLMKLLPENAEHRDMLTMLSEGHTYKEIGDKYGVSKQRANIVVQKIKKQVRARALLQEVQTNTQA